MTINYLGYTKVQSDLIAKSSTNHCNVHVSMNAYNDYSSAYLGFHSDSSDILRAFAQVYDHQNNVLLFHKTIEELSFNTYYTFKIEWTGSTLDYYIDGILKTTYDPSSDTIDTLNRRLPRNLGIGSWCEPHIAGSTIAGFSDNFYAKP